MARQIDQKAQAQTRPAPDWFVLTDGTLVWGKLWETFNNVPRRPRYDMRPIDDSIEFRPILMRRSELVTEMRRAKNIKGLHLRPVKVDFEGCGPGTKIKIRGASQG